MNSTAPNALLWLFENKINFLLKLLPKIVNLKNVKQVLKVNQFFIAMTSLKKLPQKKIDFYLKNKIYYT